MVNCEFDEFLILFQISTDGSPVSLCGSLARRSLFSSKRQREDVDDHEDSPLKRSRQGLISWDGDSDDEEERTRSAVERLQAVEKNLVGDGSRVHSLPTVETRNHRDLKTVTPLTVCMTILHLSGNNNENIHKYGTFLYAQFNNFMIN